MSYRYPAKEELEADVSNETTAINVAITAMHESIEDCPLSNHLKVYAAIELAFKLGDKKYVEEVFNEVLLFKPNN